jgi:hypothetical protein
MRRRRQDREHQAYMQSILSEPDSADAWNQIEPLLDHAMGELDRKDHDALVVRFFEGRNFKEASALLGTTEAGAKMRVNRALERLRKIFTKRGISISAAVIAGAVSMNSVHAAPATLAASVTMAAVKGTAVTTSTATLIQLTLKYMAWTKVKIATAIGAVALLSVGTATVMTQPSPAPTTTTKPKTETGYTTPEATLQTLIAALKAADHQKFAASCTPEKAAQFHARNADKSPEELKQEALAQAKAFEKLEVVSKRTISPTEIHMHIKGVGHSPGASAGDREVVARMKKIGNDWKFDGEQR